MTEDTERRASIIFRLAPHCITRGGVMRRAFGSESFSELIIWTSIDGKGIQATSLYHKTDTVCLDSLCFPGKASRSQYSSNYPSMFYNLF